MIKLKFPLFEIVNHSPASNQHVRIVPNFRRYHGRCVLVVRYGFTTVSGQSSIKYSDGSVNEPSGEYISTACVRHKEIPLKELPSVVYVHTITYIYHCDRPTGN